MPITCSTFDIDDYDVPGPFYTDFSDEYITAPVLGRRKRCASCNAFINPGALCTAHPRWTFPRTDVEADIVGEDTEIPLAPVWVCEECSDLFLSFLEKGFSVFPHEDQHDNLVHYHDYVHLEGKDRC